MCRGQALGRVYGYRCIWAEHVRRRWLQQLYCPASSRQCRSAQFALYIQTLGNGQNLMSASTKPLNRPYGHLKHNAFGNYQAMSGTHSPGKSAYLPHSLPYKGFSETNSEQFCDAYVQGCRLQYLPPAGCGRRPVRIQPGDRVASAFGTHCSP